MPHYTLKEIEGKPTDLVVRRTGENVLISLNAVNLLSPTDLAGIAKEPKPSAFFAKITNEGWVNTFRRYVPATLPTAGNKTELKSTTTPDWKEWLQPESGTFLDVIIGFRSDRFTAWEVKMGARTMGSIKSAQDEDKLYNPGDVVHIQATNHNHPSFTLYNYSRYTLTMAEAYILVGRQYSFSEYSDPSGRIPEPFSSIVLGDPTTS